MYSASRTDLKNIVQWLRGVDESQWEHQSRLLAATIAVLREISRPVTRPDEAGSRSREPDLLPPRAAEINAAMPYLRGMLASMNRHGRDYALEYGEAALDLPPEK
jgi:hypothetical protein